jgi:hypothetical protein
MRFCFVFLRFLILSFSAAIASDTEYREALESTRLESLNSYIVIFKKHLSLKTRVAHHRWLASEVSTYEAWNYGDQSSAQIPLEFRRPRLVGLKYTYDINGQLFGYSGQFDDVMIEKIQQHPDVW